MATLSKTKKTMKQLILSNKKLEMVARLGDLDGVIKADNKSNVYVTLMDGEVLTVLNQTVPKLIMYVVIGYRNNILQVLRSLNAFHTPSLPDIPDHNHTWGASTNPTWVRGEQYVVGLVAPGDGLSVHFKGGIVFINDTFVPVLEQDVDISAHVPVTGALFGLLEADANGVITILEGDAVAGRGALAYTDIPTPSIDKVSLNFAIKLYAGQSRVSQGLSYTDTDLIDLRGSGYGSGGSGTFITDWENIQNLPSWMGKALEPATIVTGREMPSYFIDGTLAVLTDVTASFVAQRYMKLHSLLIHCKDKGSAGTTIVDMNLNGTTVFTDQDKRPMLDWDAADDFAISDTPDVIELAPGDVLTWDIDSIGTDASELTITPYERVVELATIEDDIATIQMEMT